MSNNPLQRYFRQPAIYMQLPSKGAHYPQGTLDIPPNGELPVYPMTAMDEITYRTADGLFNGSAVINVIKSCVPNILDPWEMSTADLDAVLVAIRIASFGHELEIESVCPECKEENNFVLDLRSIIENIGLPDYNATVTKGDIEVYFKPLNYRQQNKNAIEQFEDQKILSAIPEADIPDEQKLEMINNAMLKLGEMNVVAITNSISMIRAAGDIVDNQDHIKEFIRNCDSNMYKLIQEHILALRADGSIKPVQAQCSECNHTYSSPFTLDVSNFFGQDS